MLTNYARRRALGIMIGSLFSSACAARNKKVTLDVVLFSYLSRSIFDVYLGRSSIGVAGKYPRSGRGTVSGVELQLGTQEVRWRVDGEGLPEAGTTVTAANIVSLESVPQDARYLGVHIYPDNTVELVCSRHFPTLSQRGEEFDKEWRRNNGKR